MGFKNPLGASLLSRKTYQESIINFLLRRTAQLIKGKDTL